MVGIKAGVIMNRISMGYGLCVDPPCHTPSMWGAPSPQCKGGSACHAPSMWAYDSLSPSTENPHDCVDGCGWSHVSRKLCANITYSGGCGP